MKKFFSLVIISLPAILLGACGGGDSSSPSPTIAPSSALTTTLDGLAGTYVAACSDESYTPSQPESAQASIVITPPNAVTAHLQTYDGSANCTAATLKQDLTVTGQLKGKATTKSYKDATGKSLTANVVTFSLTGMTLSKGTITGSLPTPGVTTDIAYVLSGNTLNVAKGNREADGLGDSLSRPFVKQ
ncbi:MAG: hypothetical protein JWR21_988 [Herminiimonas sp.]|jgi:hypothetical protein|nr:hypothetical protein [Herminiimonas sp.]MDB5852358.1 hypothetical protein [Herminiimonas sp.]